MKKLIGELLFARIGEKYGIHVSDLNFEIPPKKELGDLAFGCYTLARELKLAPMKIAQDLTEYIILGGLPVYLERVEAVGPYLNFFFSNNFYESQLQKVLQNQETYFFGDTAQNAGKHIIIDYIGANVGKPLHIGHMCTPNQGQVFINLYRKLGYQVIADSHLGDWGIIFGKLILAYKIWGDEKKLKGNAVEYLFELYVQISKRIEDEGIISKIYENFVSGIHDLDEKIQKIKPGFEPSFQTTGWKYRLFIFDKNLSYNILKEYFSETTIPEYNKQLADLLPLQFDELYLNGIKINDIEENIRNEFKLLSEGNPDSVELWKEFTKYSIEGMRNSLSRIYVQPDYDIGESFYEGLGLPKMQDYPDLSYKMHDIVLELIEKRIATRNEEDNSVGVIFPEKLKIPSCILQKRDGTHGYLASDLAAIKYRVQNWNPEKILYFVDVRQQLHFTQAFTIAKLAGWIDEHHEIYHAYNGFVTLKEGAMSTRKGNIIKLDALLDEAHERAKKIILEKREDISGDELKKLSEIIGIGAIKYGYLKKSRESDVIFDWDEFMSFDGNSGPYIQYSYVRAKKILQKSDICDFKDIQISKKEEKELLSHLLNFPQIILTMQDGYHAHVLCQFVYDASKLLSSFYANIAILQEENLQMKQARLALLTLYTRVIEVAFQEILGIPLAQEM